VRDGAEVGALVRGCDAGGFGRGRGELAAADGVAGADAGWDTEAGAGEVAETTAAARPALGCAAHPVPLTASSSAGTAHQIRVTGTSSLPDGRPAIRRAVRRPIRSPRSVRPLA